MTTGISRWLPVYIILRLLTILPQQAVVQFERVGDIIRHRKLIRRVAWTTTKTTNNKKNKNNNKNNNNNNSNNNNNNNNNNNDNNNNNNNNNNNYNYNYNSNNYNNNNNNIVPNDVLACCSIVHCTRVPPAYAGTHASGRARQHFGLFDSILGTVEKSPHTQS